MKRSPVRATIDLSNNQQHQCHCLGYAQHSQQYFLTHKSLQIKNQPTPSHSTRQEDHRLSIKNSGKRSLRKNLRADYESPLTVRTNEPLQEYYSQKKIPSPKVEYQRTMKTIEETRSIHLIKPERTEIITENRAIDPHLMRNNNQNLVGWHQTQQNVFYTPPPTSFSPPRIIMTHQTPIRINFSHSPHQINPQKYSPHASPREFPQIIPQNDGQSQAKKLPTLSDVKQQLRINIAPIKQLRERGASEDHIDFQLTIDPMDSPRNLPTDRKTQPQLLAIEQPTQNNLFVNNQIQYFHFGDTFKSKIEKPKSNKKKQTYKSKIQTNKSRIDTVKSRIEPKKSMIGEMGKSKVKSLRQEKKSLKKMDDVQEIRSMVDSDELSEEDKQSVVLGRLHEYGSMLDPSLSLTTPTLRSKLISMNTQSSTIGKSFMKPFEFSIERAHFK